jgi:hypothetical protein
MTVSETTDDFMEDAQKKERKIINNIKLDTIGKLINEAKFQNYQSKYNLLVEPKIREILSNIPLLDLDTLNGASVVAEEEAKEVYIYINNIYTYTYIKMTIQINKE